MAVNDYDPIVQEAAHEWNVDPLWLKAIMQQESHGSPVDKYGKPIRSTAGAGGLMQIMPETAAGLGVQNLDDPTQSIFGAAKLLSQLREKYRNAPNPVAAATAAYNARPSTVDAWLAGKGNLPDETQKYVPKVAEHYQNFQKVTAPTAVSTPLTLDDNPMGQLPPTYKVGIGHAPYPIAMMSTPEGRAAATSAQKSDLNSAAAAAAKYGFTSHNGVNTPASSQPPHVGAGAPSSSILSDDDFLKATGGKSGAAPGASAAPNEMSDADFLKMTGGGQPTAAPAQDKVAKATQLGEAEGANPYDTGAPLPPGAGEGLKSIGSAMAQGAARGFGPVTPDNPIGLSPQQEATLRGVGIYGPTGGGTPVQRLNEAMINPLVSGTGLALRTLGGGFGALQAGVAQAGAVAGQPQLGRDLAAFPEAFPTGIPEAGAAARGFAENPLVARPMTRATPLAADVAPGGIVRNPLLAEVPVNPLAASAPSFVPPGSAVPAALRAAPEAPGVPPVGAMVRDPVTGAVSPIVQPLNPLSTVPHSTGEAAAIRPEPPASAVIPAAQAAIPTTSADAKAIASTLYAKADSAGGQLAPAFTNKLLDHAESLAPQTPEGQAIAGNNELTALTQRMQALRDKPISLQGAQEIDEQIGNLVDKEYGPKGLTKDGKNLLDLQSSFRNMIRDAGPGDVVGGTEGFDALSDARQAWAQAMKMDDLERIATRASMTDNPATGIKSGVRTLLANRSRARGYSPDEIAALKAAGDRGVIGGALHVFGSRLMPLATGAAGFGAEGPMSAIMAAGATHLGSTMLRNAASGLQARRLNNALQVLGSKVPLQSP